MAKENNEYQYHIIFNGYDRDNGENPAYHLNSVIIAFLDALVSSGVIDDYNSEMYKVSERVNDAGEVVRALY